MAGRSARPFGELSFLGKLARVLGVAILSVCVAGVATDADAAKRKSKKRANVTRSQPQFESHKYASFVINPETGRVIHSENADSMRYPASLTKMMTVYLTFEGLSRGNIRLDQKITVSEYAAAQPALDIGLREGDVITIEKALISTIVRSANDAAVVLAEAISGSEYEFAEKMTRKAKELGMSRTTFRNASGLPDEEQRTTAKDMAQLAIALLRDYPQYYHYFKTPSFTWKGVAYKTHNRVNQNYAGADGLKTGYIRASGFNLVTSAVRNGTRLVGVVMGGPTAAVRDARMIALLDRSFGKDGAGNNVYASSQVSPVINEYGEGSAEEKPEVTTLSQSAASEASIGDKIWSIQVGAFNDAKQAFIAASNSVSMASEILSGSKVKVASEGSHSQAIHRARIVNLTLSQAEKACRFLAAQNENCFVVKNSY